ncbi:hypothetical protein H696_00205 [Fonticula alba]|uniref:U2A'/phosphoprotein 32 family A C-terminal domain-containing protein n=1 Tax=Fonticula alba TaxID=691883 RepID=A0A058ZF91_FONAL|nr:hypothetical protein H696_00205 [Fonticula alba]KCV72621.1 hypothetical protein H696_00205 [Fonticula alba]|eukprot:XP_009492322.1 hypothetical protein H696_00205 [Fonticula alba]
MRLTLARISEIAGQDPREMTSFASRDSGITELDDLSPCVNMVRIDLTKNAIKDLSGLAHNYHLSVIYASFNQIEDMSDLAKLKSARVIHLGGNNITTISGLENLTELRALVLNNNRITRAEGFGHLPHLNTIVLSHNPLSMPPVIRSFPKTLTKLALANTGLRAVPEDLGKHLPELQELSLNGNKILSIGDALTGCGRLRVLDLGNNLLHTLETLVSLKELSALSNLNIRGNPFKEAPESEQKSAADEATETASPAEGDADASETADEPNTATDTKSTPTPTALPWYTQFVTANVCPGLRILDGRRFDPGFLDRRRKRTLLAQKRKDPAAFKEVTKKLAKQDAAPAEGDNKKEPGMPKRDVDRAADRPASKGGRFEGKRSREQGGPSDRPEKRSRFQRPGQPQRPPRSDGDEQPPKPSKPAFGKSKMFSSEPVTSGAAREYGTRQPKRPPFHKKPGSFQPKRAN